MPGSTFIAWTETLLYLTLHMAIKLPNSVLKYGENKALTEVHEIQRVDPDSRQTGTAAACRCSKRSVK